VAGVQAGTVVTKPFAITAGGSRHMVIKIVASDVTVVGTITAKLQTAIGDDWVDSKTVAITEDGNFYIKLMVETAGDQTYLPLLDVGRVLIVNTNAGDTVTIDAVEVLQEL
jgi:hypothetical protein